MSPRDLRLFLILRSVVGTEMKRADDHHRRELLADSSDDPDDAMQAGERRHVHVRGPGGERVSVGTVRVDPAPVKVRVTDPAAFLAWVAKVAPDEIVDAVRPSYEARVLDTVKRHGQGIDPRTSELVDVPGVEVETGDPKVVVTAARGAADALADAHQRGDLPQLAGFMATIGPGGPRELPADSEK